MKELRFEVGKPGTDPTLPNVVLSINGEEYPLAFDFASIALVGKLTGMNLLLAVMDEPSFEGTVAIFWAAAKKAKPQLTYDDAAALVDLQNVYVVLGAVRAAWGASQPDAQPEGGEAGEAEAQADLLEA